MTGQGTHAPSLRIHVDVSGLVQWYSYLQQPSGLQRVEERILQSAPVRSAGNVSLIARGLGSPRFHAIGRECLWDLADPAHRPAAIDRLRQCFTDGIRTASVPLLARDVQPMHVRYLARAALSAFRAVPPAVAPGKDSVILGLGDFWCHASHAGQLVALKQRSGARLVQMVHDLFALTRPDWTHPYFGPLIRTRLETLTPHVDKWLVNSHFVAGELGAFLRTASGGRIAPVEVIPMGWQILAGARVDVRDKYGLTNQDYILHVGTLEPRKNLVELIDAVARVPNAPVCVLVGRDGWRSAEIRERIASVPKVRWLREVPDEDLPSLYEGARFTVVPSLGEGWGLPVQESLMHGVPCIAARAGALPEVGGELVRYVDPATAESLAEAIADWWSEPAKVVLARQRIRARLQTAALPTWNEAGTKVLEAISRS